ncbi:rSAM-modified peptide [Flavobacterium gelatinilyticum]|nr:rSAM-modified peptide [Flavobacterium gelatinilyticum]
MKKMQLKFEDFQVEKLTKEQQKTVRGGDAPPTDPVDPNKGTGGNGVG